MWEKEIKTFCHHGLKCDNCYCYSCDNDFMAENFRFFQLDIIFLKSQSEHYDEIKSIEKEVNLFNENVVKLFLEYKEIIEKLENESRKKRILRHFNKLRNDFIKYQKLKLIIVNIIRRNQNVNLLLLFSHLINYQLNFKTFNYDKKLTLDKNISRLSTYFASKNRR